MNVHAVIQDFRFVRMQSALHEAKKKAVSGSHDDIYCYSICAIRMSLNNFLVTANTVNTEKLLTEYLVSSFTVILQ